MDTKDTIQQNIWVPNTFPKVDGVRNKTGWYIAWIKQNTLHDLNEQILEEN